MGQRMTVDHPFDQEVAGGRLCVRAARLAVASRPREFVVDVVGDGARLATASLATGLGGALAVARLMRGLLWAVPPSDPVALGLSAALLGAASLAATLIPAVRAARVDPVQALRLE
jgi:hypothetical protein